MVFGYGSLAVSERGEALSPTARAMLTEAVGGLGWDLARLRDDRFRPVTNALYGNPVAYGVPSTVSETPQGPPIDVLVQFRGSFVAGSHPAHRCLFNDPIARQTGVYLWTVEVENEERVWYVGQTRVRFGIRTAQHLAGMLSGEYSTVDAGALKQGLHRRVGSARPGAWPSGLPTFLDEYEGLVPHIVGTIRSMRFHFALLTGDGHLFNRVESAIAWHYKRHPNDALRNFLTPGLRVPAAIPFDKPLRLVISSEGAIAGLPQELII
jgi:hypothetical protein